MSQQNSNAKVNGPQSQEMISNNTTSVFFKMQTLTVDKLSSIPYNP